MGVKGNVATRPWRSAPLRRGVVVLLVSAIGVSAGLGAVALTQGRHGASRRPATPSVGAFHFPTRGAIGSVAADQTPEPFAEPASPGAALEAFLGAERDGETARSYRLLTAVDQQDVGSAAAWAAGVADRARPVAFGVVAWRSTVDGNDVTADVTRQPSLDPFAGFVSERAMQVWRVVQEAGSWRVQAAPLSEEPVLPPVAAAVDTAVRWAQASASCDRTAAVPMQAVADLSGPADLLTAPCREHGSWAAAGAPTTLDRAPDVQALVEAYGPDVGSWARLVPVRGLQTHFFAAVAPLGEDWRVIGVTSDGG